MGGIEQLGFKRRWVKLNVGFNIGILFAKDFLALNIDFDTRGHPSARECAVVLKANLLKFLRVSLRRLKQPDEQQAILLHPELLRLQIAFVCAYNVDWLAFPSLLMKLC